LFSEVLILLPKAESGSIFHKNPEFLPLNSAVNKDGIEGMISGNMVIDPRPRGWGSDQPVVNPSKGRNLENKRAFCLLGSIGPGNN
jgi:hypothetical protein